jgi:luciferase family oxidoreductase group 1
MHALRRHLDGADTFPQDVLELQGYLRGESRIPGVVAMPGAGTDVPLYILGSSLFGASLAAALGLPYGFASHFAPDALADAVATYRREFQPSGQLDRPYVVAGVNVIAADTDDDAQAQFLSVRRSRAAVLVGGDRDYSDTEADRLLQTPRGQYVGHMMRYSAVGTPSAVGAYLDGFTELADADELIVVPASPTLDARLRSIELLAHERELRPYADVPSPTRDRDFSRPRTP